MRGRRGGGGACLVLGLMILGLILGLILLVVVLVLRLLRLEVVLEMIGGRIEGYSRQMKVVCRRSWRLLLLLLVVVVVLCLNL